MFKQQLFYVLILLLLSGCGTGDGRSNVSSAAADRSGQAAHAAAPVKVVRLATLEWPPYISKKVKKYGYVYRIAVEAFRAAGWTVEIRFFPWARALATARSGRYDGLFPEYYDRSRLKDFSYSQPFPGGPVGLMKRWESSLRYRVDPRRFPVQALRTFAGKRVGVVRGYVNTPEFDRADYLHKEPVSGDLQNLRKLLAGRLDLIFIDKYVAKWLLVTRLPHKVGEAVLLEPPLAYKPLYIAFSRQADRYCAKVAAFNRGLEILRRSGRLRQLVEQAGMHYRRVR